jgi:hypothetical protein
MRKRLLDPGFFLNEELAECDPMARLLFAGLTLYCDKEGKFEWRPKRIRGAIFPHDRDIDIANLLGQLQASAFITQYNVNGNDYAIIPTFLKHQSPHIREKRSSIPDPPSPEIPRNSTEFPEIPVTSVPVPVPIKALCSSSIEAAQLLKNLLLKEMPNAKTPADLITGKRSWASEIDRMIRIDNRDPPEILKMIRWIYNENLQGETQFVVQSAKALRTKYDRIETQIKKHQPRRVEDPHKDRRCKTCLSWQDTPNWLNKEGYCERCEALPPN